MFTIPLPHFLPRGWVNKLCLVWNSLPLAKTSLCYNSIVCRLVGDCLPPQYHYIHSVSRLGHVPLLRHVKWCIFCGMLNHSFCIVPLVHHICVCECQSLRWQMPFLVWVAVDLEYWKAVFSPRAVRVNECERMFSLWGIRTPGNTKVCSWPLKHSVIFLWNTFWFIRFPVHCQKAFYNCLDSILRHQRCATISKAVQKCIQDIHFDQNLWPNHVCSLLRKHSQNALGANL